MIDSIVVSPLKKKNATCRVVGRQSTGDIVHYNG